ncbi:Tex family protein [Intestinimonas butyriciproducens]|uniref:S1 motif domain-containing protein n=1 Tax=Intestinimonas butyriciproducens TaxID=1297617 RepID=A0A2U1C1I3_9FIRM|nr:Tex family protein [Intestinimonas butyriciproducens]SCJ03776.1 30S ribosomal protein S1 [uncultured Clostridium sp.]MCI6362389.1 RNA-binding transcriptional accessory protein [Intestinimonas butyriciproducens]MCR1906684.1 RNA-binding transcriptional accessory protein [Intestinimonas butyriciproducens]MDB7830958.1 Tex family protein [Intestinimonas butyriciproducens]MDB7860302.1 Tex family protein [Intestinimonas butyriciproducens]
MDAMIQILAKELSQDPIHVENVVKLIDEGNTIPFIARYRKELHGAMDDTALRTLADRLQYLRNLEKRRGEVKAAVDGQGKLTEALSTAIDAAATLAEVEDLYRPYRQKRRTRATVAREKGLEPLAALLFAQGRDCSEPLLVAAGYVDPQKGVETPEQALQGASDIVAEQISDDAALRKRLRALWWSKGVLISTAAKKDQGDSVYRLYYDFKTPVNRVQGHQVLAINRGEREDLLKVSVELDRETALITVRRSVLIPGSPAMPFVRSAAEDAYDRLIAPSVEREIRNMLTEQADEGAIRMFGLNLKPLLMQPPVKGFVTMGLDPGYRNGCKVAVVDGTGKVLDTAVVYPTFSERKKQEAIDVLSRLIKKHGVAHIAIGNGTASRETEQMAVELIQAVGGGVSYMIVSEAGASVYSASKLAAEEFPDYDVNLRSAVSIARRLQDPLAELVKIDPKAIGVGQYQHDMPQARLDETLSGVVEDCVNAVGVDLNTASAPLLSRVSGLSAATAKNIVRYREENGAFTSRKQVLKVPKLGPKAFEQCAGFLRVPESKNVLDHTAVHPESYAAAEQLLALCGYDLNAVEAGGIGDLRDRVTDFGEERAAQACGVGLPTLRDLVGELMKPGRDPRDELPKPILRTDVMEIKDLKPGMELTGTVRNVIDFGVFVDIGVHQDGLVHISQLCERRVRHPSEVCAVGDIVMVWVLEVDEKKKRISLTMKKPKGDL